MTAKRAKKQHFVPRFYLQNFVDGNGMVWTFDKDSANPAADARQATPENTAVTTNFYSLQDADGNYVDAVEDLLAHLEDNAAPLFAPMLAGAVPTGEDKDKLAAFFAGLYARSPVMINNIAWLTAAMAQTTTGLTLSDRALFDESMDRHEKEEGKEATSKKERDEMFELMQDREKFEMVVSQKAGLMAIDTINPLMDIFAKMHWILVRSPHQHLITSDNPVVKISPQPPSFFGDGGFLAKGVFVNVPLSPTMLLEMSWREGGAAKPYEVDRDRGRLYNRQRAGFAARYLYSSRNDSGIGALAKKNRGHAPTIRVDGGPKLSPIRVKRKLD